MEPNQAIIFYLLFFRLAVVSAGVIAIILGYRLFIHGTQIIPPKSSDQEIEVKFGVTQFTLKNTAPGTCFALFGAALIITMLIQSPPGVEHTGSGGITYRSTGVPRSSIPDLSLLLKEDTTSAAIQSYWQKNAPALNNMAWLLYEKDKHLKLAFSLVEIAIYSDSQSSNIQHYEDTRFKIHTRLNK